MKTNISLLATIAVLALALPFTSQAATQVYDLSGDWSDTANPNGTWSYWDPLGGLLANDPYPWVWVNSEGPYSITKITDADAVPGYLEAGDVSVSIPFWGPVGARWTAPASGTISISGTMWDATPDAAAWALTQNGSTLSEDIYGAPVGPRSAPYDLSSGSGGASALQSIAVAKDDQVELAFFSAFNAIGVNFTIIFTPDSVDPVSAIEDLAQTVAVMNLQNGIENSLDSKLDAALNALDDVNFNNDGAACISLAAFINAVEAQRGKKISSSQADQLIAAAQAIRTSLNCGN